jgi:hypothetical protein
MNGKVNLSMVLFFTTAPLQKQPGGHARVELTGNAIALVSPAGVESAAIDNQDYEPREAGSVR